MTSIQNEGNKQFVFSVILSVYNTEKYIRESIDSILNQTIGFRENIQLILINDGSTDNSEAICLEYLNRFPDNIVYEKKKNGGAASARNAGLKYVKGRFVNFFDSDDIWEQDAFDRVFSFFDVHYDEIDLVAGRLRYFESKEGFLHPLDYKFKGDRVVDLTEDYRDIILSAGNSFFKAEVLDGRAFNEKLETYEDATFINELILERCKYGAMESVVYHYRQRSDSSSLINKKHHNKDWFFQVPEAYFKNIIKKSIDIYGKVLPHIQYAVMYGMQWRIRSNESEVLSADERRQYADLVRDILQYIEDSIIYEQKNINVTHKLYAFRLKYGKDIIKESLVDDSGFITFKGTRVFNIKANLDAE